MILTADKPHYIPSLSYFVKMAQANIFVLADDILYTSGSAVNRAAVKSADGKHWLTVPVLSGDKGAQLIREVEIDREKNWRQKHRKAIYLNYKFAPYFEYYADFFEGLYQQEWQSLLELNIAIIKFLRKALRISNRLVLSSELQTRTGATEKIIDIVKAMNCDRYLAWQSDRDFLNAELFQQEGIELVYRDFQTKEYRQQFGEFLPDLSIIDLLFNRAPEAKQFLLHQH